MEKIKKFLKKTLIVTIILIAIVFSFLYWGSYSKGVRSGIILKVSEKGVMFKTVEGEMNMQILTSGPNQNLATQIWIFSVEKSKKDIIEKLQKASLTGERVELKYVQRYMKFFWRGDTEYFVTDVIFNQQPPPGNPQ
jgi:hypothetical protein